MKNFLKKYKHQEIQDLEFIKNSPQLRADKEWTTDDPIVDPKLGTQLGEGLKNIGDASNPKISFEPADKDEDD